MARPSSTRSYYPGPEDPHQPAPSPQRPRVHPWGHPRCTRGRCGLGGELLPRRGNHRRENTPSDEIQAHLKQVERLGTLEGRLDAILHGQEVPADAEGKFDVA